MTFFFQHPPSEATQKSAKPVCREVMIDIETLGKRRGCAILSIGAVAFDFEHGEYGEEFYIHVQPGSNVDHGLDVDVETVMWWSQQAEEARKSLVSDHAVSLPKALEALRTYLVAARKQAGGKVCFWSNDPEFDAQILEGAYQAVGRATPWSFWENRSCRTIMDLAKRKTKIDFKKEFPRNGVYHDALDDSKYQASQVKRAYDELF